eukprot:4875879-Alexandrium_andersonii.AAC.1
MQGDATVGLGKLDGVDTPAIVGGFGGAHSGRCILTPRSPQLSPAPPIAFTTSPTATLPYHPRHCP